MDDFTVHVQPTGGGEHRYVSVGTEDVIKARAVGQGESLDGGQVSVINAGRRHPNEVSIYYHLSDDVEHPLVLRICHEDGRLIRVFQMSEEADGRPSTTAGIHKVVWDLRYPSAVKLEPEQHWFMEGNYYLGPTVPPGTYRVELRSDRGMAERSFKVEVASQDEQRHEEIHEQTKFLLEVRDRISSAHEVVASIRSTVRMIDATIGIVTTPDPVQLRVELQAAETLLVSRDVTGAGDYQRYPSGLNTRLMALAFRVGESAGPVTRSHREVLEVLAARQSTIMARLRGIAAPIGEVLRQGAASLAAREPVPFPGGDLEFESIWRG
jgi:hypothetical protein